MRFSLELLLATFFLVARTAASSANIYISGPPSKAAEQALSPIATRLLLARRLGLSQYHSLEGADEALLKLLNDFGGEQRALLSTEEQWQGHQRNLIVVDGVENPKDLLSVKAQEADFTINDPPQSSDTSLLVNDLFKQARNAPAGERELCSHDYNNIAGTSGGLVFGSSQTGGACPYRKLDSQDGISLLQDISTAIPSRTAILHISFPDTFRTSRKSEDTTQLSQTLINLLRPDSGHETTIILMPPSNPKAKRSPTSPYGTYAMPASKRLAAREVQSEALLTAPSPAETSLASHRHSTPQTIKTSSVASPGILPVCQSSLDKLIDATNNCSGHGMPYLKHNGTSDESSKCYACKCQKTVLNRGDGKGVKTVEWAGPACSKKDVSIPFWLLAGITIGLVATVSWGVGLLFSIGQEELPSVIGAGVAGPRAQK